VPEQPDADDRPDPERVQSRADSLLAEEREAGSDDPTAQAEAILAESDARTEDRVDPPGQPVEHRESEDTVEPAGGRTPAADADATDHPGDTGG
jgi:hypothetical protein